MDIAQAHEREVLRQAGIALHGRVVTLWEISPKADATPLFSSVADPPAHETTLDLETTLRRWGAPLIQHSRWIGCRLADGSDRWCVAPVRLRPAAPPPRPPGVERRSRERMILELAGLSLGFLGIAAGAAQARLPPADALREMARRPSVIAHEVGNPLAVALGNLDLSLDALRDASALDPRFRAQLLDDLAHVAQGIEQAADYLRSIQDRPFGATAQLARFDVVSVVRSCVTLERPLGRKHGVTLKWSSGMDALYLFGDPGAFYQVITNLIRNAVDASRPSSGSVTITVEREGENLILAVRDSGVGIAPENVSRIFAAGYTTKPPGQGSGIGLSVVKEITENMFGGTIAVVSQPDAGSTFTLVLPIPPQRR
ncbi:MAG TPA: HAMP domain-containing sensor histidine kinase [Gemmatimonadales bacterium]|nr:HAMP domain-containing sensor histidine kinase [Gemmatimonadales bacterium]